MKKIPSFTIIELIVAMLIGSIVISICYYSFFLMNNRFNKFYTKSQKISEYQLFNKSFQIDIYNASSITHPADNSLYFYFDHMDSATYFINDSSIVRSQHAAIDTFRLSGILSSATPLNDSIPLISLIRIDISIDKEKIPVTWIKEYTSKELIKYYTVLHE